MYIFVTCAIILIYYICLVSSYDFCYIPFLSKQKTPTASPIIPPPSIKVAVIGDSLTDEDTSLQVYPPFMRLYLETYGPSNVEFDIRDYAITGSTGCIAGYRSYMNTTDQQCSDCPIVYEQAKIFHPNNPPTQPDLAIVMLGANDSKDGNWNGVRN